MAAAKQHINPGAKSAPPDKPEACQLSLAFELRIEWICCCCCMYGVMLPKVADFHQQNTHILVSTIYTEHANKPLFGL